MHHAFPYRLALECLADGDRLGERGGAAVHLLDDFLQLIGFNFGHVCRISCRHGGRPPTRGDTRSQAPTRYSFFALSFCTPGRKRDVPGSERTPFLRVVNKERVARPSCIGLIAFRSMIGLRWPARRAFSWPRSTPKSPTC